MLETYWVYILECSNGNYYTGYTSNIVKRYSEHLKGNKKSKFTRSFKPIKIAQLWMVRGAKGSAMRVEAYIKKNNRDFKDYLIENPHKLKNLLFKELGLDLKITKRKIPPVIIDQN